MKDHIVPLLPGHTYHVYNRAVGNEKLFVREVNYRFFLQKFISQTSPFSNIYCYALLPNHFHFLLKIKPVEELTSIKDDIPGHISRQFSNLFNSYTKSFNEIYGRKGSLFMTPFKRSVVTKDDYFSKLVHYIHANPVHHGICKSIYDWEHSSIKHLTGESNTHLLKVELMDFFGGRGRFIEFHQQPISLKFRSDFG